MKIVHKKLNIIGAILMVMVVFLCAFNVTYAYFTARATVEGNLTFYDLNLTFGYVQSNSNQAVSTGQTAFTINPNADNVLRGQAFGFQLTDGTALKNVSIMSNAKSCNAYVRVKVVAVKMKDATTADDDTTDYGKYITLTTPSTVATNTTDSTDYWYYVRGQVRTSGTIEIATAATISIDAPADVTNGYLKITLVFDAVQATTAAVTELWGSTAATLVGAA